MKSNVTSSKATGATVDKKKAAQPESKTVAAAKPKATAAKVKAEAVTIMPEQNEPKTPVALNAETIALRAYLLWEASGYAHGSHEDHWLAAEKQLKSELSN